VYQHEPSSIIAYALASSDYENQLADLKTDLHDQSTPLSSQPIKAHSQSDRPDRWFDNIEREEPRYPFRLLVFNFLLSCLCY